MEEYTPAELRARFNEIRSDSAGVISDELSAALREAARNIGEAVNERMNLMWDETEEDARLALPPYASQAEVDTEIENLLEPDNEGTPYGDLNALLSDIEDFIGEDAW
jgi:hypothetical protein